MRSFRRPTYYLAFIFSCWATQSLQAQTLPDSTEILRPEEVSAYQEQVAQLVSFVEYSFNLLGSSQSAAQEKQVIISESYLKAFRDAEVQIEDDLLPNRRVVTNKNVQAYLKDVDFFFRTVEFDFEIDEITYHLSPESQPYFKVQMNRTLKGMTVEGDSLNSIETRYIEVNLDRLNRDLKIASMYTTKLSEEEILANWWNELPYGWKRLFGSEVSVSQNMTYLDLMNSQGEVNVGDTLSVYVDESLASQDTALVGNLDALDPNSNTSRQGRSEVMVLNKPMMYSHIRQIKDQEELDLSKNMQILDLAPLSGMTQLKRLNLSGTGISSLFPIRNLTQLEILDISSTTVRDLSVLKYASSIKELNISNTRIQNLQSLANFSRLERLYMEKTSVDDITPLSKLLRLQELDANGSPIPTIEPLRYLSQLTRVNLSNAPIMSIDALSRKDKMERLDISKTKVLDLGPLSDASSLKILRCDDTRIASLAPLSNLPNLTNVYCDRTDINQAEANNYMRAHPATLVMYETDMLRVWWDKLSSGWRSVFTQLAEVTGSSPSPEALSRITNITSIDISDNKRINDLSPLKALPNLTQLNCNNTAVYSLVPIGDILDLEFLSCANTQVNDLSPLSRLSKLQIINMHHTPVNSLAPLAKNTNLTHVHAEYTQINDLEPLINLPKLQFIYCDHTPVKLEQVRYFDSDALVIFQTEKLEQWWSSLSPAWVELFRQHIKLDEQPKTEQLHQLAFLPQIELRNNNQITKLMPLTSMIRLKYLIIENTQIQDLTPLRYISTLQKFRISKSPVTDLSPLATQKKLIRLDIESTPISDLDDISTLYQLQELNCAGTQVKDIRPISGFKSLRLLDISNTPIKNIKYLVGMNSLEVLQCYNTKLSSRKIDDFKSQMPKVEVVYY